MKKLAGLTIICLLATGCHHRRPAAPAIALAPVEPVPIDKPAEMPGVVLPAPATTAPLPSVKLPAVRAKKVKKKTPPIVAPAPAVAANPAPPAPVPVGTLTTDGEDSADTSKRAAALLAGLEKRVAALPQSVLQTQPEQIARVKHFWSQAHSALAAGDADGAYNLATKAKVLLDDVTR